VALPGAARTQRAELAAGRLQPKQRAITLDGVLESLKALRRNRVRVAGAEFDQVSEPTDDQRRLLDRLGVKLPGLL
jgi:hypothetical protein